MPSLERAGSRSSARAALAVLLCLTFARGAIADRTSDENGRRAQTISESMVSPFCPATTLAYCSSQYAAEWRTEIRKWVDQGLSDQEICRRMEARAGHPLCGGRPRSFLGWGFPIVVSVAIIGVLALVLRRFLRGGGRAGEGDTGASVGGGATAPEDPELDAKLDRELSRLEDD